MNPPSEIAAPRDLRHWTARLSKLRRCRHDILPVADELKALPAQDIETLTQQLIVNGEQTALEMLLRSAAVANITLRPELLVNALSVVRHSEDVAACLHGHGEEAIDALLATAESKNTIIPARATAARFAAELTIIRDIPPSDRLRRALLHIREDAVFNPSLASLLTLTLDMLDSPSQTPVRYTIPFLVTDDPLLDLPDRAPHTISANGQPVRRAVKKMGRNDPCHCGSGKKYKRCCHDSDQEKLNDSSSHEGFTRSELRQNPSIDINFSRIHMMRQDEIERLCPEDLPSELLPVASRQAAESGLFDTAFRMLEEAQKRSDDPAFNEHYVDLFHSAIRHGDQAAARKANKRIPTDIPDCDRTDIEIALELIDRPAIIEKIEQYCKRAICGPPEGEEEEEQGFLEAHLFQALAVLFVRDYPALAIVMGRNGIIQEPLRTFDNEVILEDIHHSRITLDIEPWGDPIEPIFDDSHTLGDQAHRERLIDDTIATISAEAREATQQTKQKQRELAAKEEEIRRLKRKLDAERAVPHHTPHVPSAISDEKGNQKSLEHLRRQVSNLKVEIDSQRAKHNEFRDQIRKERARQEAQSRRSAPPEAREAPEEQDAPAIPDKQQRPLLLPEYAHEFRTACSQHPPALVAKSIKAIAAFAAYDPAIWTHARALKQLPHIYRIRIGIHCRLLLKWLPGKSLTALDLIQRQEFDTWVRNFRG